MPADKLFFEIRDGKPLVNQKHQKMIYKVGSFVNHGIVVAGYGFDDSLYGFFSDFLGYLVRSLVEKSDRIRAFRTLGLAPAYDFLQFSDKTLIVIRSETAHIPCMAYRT